MIVQKEKEKESAANLNATKNIHKMITGAVAMMNKIATITAIQESKVERIDQFTYDAEVNIRNGKKEVEGIYDDVKGKRALIIKIFAILMFFSVIYVVFLL